MKRKKRDTNHRAFIKGYQSGYQGKSFSACPHETNIDSLTAWQNGWREGHEDQEAGLKPFAIQQKAANF